MNNNFVKYLGVVVIVLFLIYFVSHLANSQRNLVEGLTNNVTEGLGSGADAEAIAKEIKTTTEKIMDSMNINKYRKDYDNIIINLEDLCNATILKNVVASNINLDTNTGDSSSKSKKTLELIETLNNLENFKNTLNSCMKFLDASS
tara:strand:+ start:1806 stop:2243 length:438 start_codon:yes stop_codon:yes gene_type:complete